MVQPNMLSLWRYFQVANYVENKIEVNLNKTWDEVEKRIEYHMAYTSII
jgi:hypothetical protein